MESMVASVAEKQMISWNTSSSNFAKCLVFLRNIVEAGVDVVGPFKDTLKASAVVARFWDSEVFTCTPDGTLVQGSL